MEELLRRAEAALARGVPPSEVDSTIARATKGELTSIDALRIGMLEGVLTAPADAAPAKVDPNAPGPTPLMGLSQRARAARRRGEDEDEVNATIARATDGQIESFSALIRAAEHERVVSQGSDPVLAGARGSAQGASFGFSDEATGAVRAVGAMVPGGIGPRQAYQEGVATSRGRLEGSREVNPTAALAGEVAGGFAIPGSLGVRAATQGTRSLRTVAAQGARVGAIEGGLFGVGTGEGAGGRVRGGALGIPTGAAAGAVAAPFASLLNRAFRPTRPRSLFDVEEAIEEVVPSRRALRESASTDVIPSGASQRAFAEVSPVEAAEELFETGEALFRRSPREISEAIAGLPADDRAFVQRGLADRLLKQVSEAGATPLESTRRMLEPDNMARLRIVMEDTREFNLLAEELRAASTDAAARSVLEKIGIIGGGIGLGGGIVKSLFDFGGGGEE